MTEPSPMARFLAGGERLVDGFTTVESVRVEAKRYLLAVGLSPLLTVLDVGGTVTVLTPTLLPYPNTC